MYVRVKMRGISTAMMMSFLSYKPTAIVRRTVVRKRLCIVIWEPSVGFADRTPSH